MSGLLLRARAGAKGAGPREVMLGRKWPRDERGTASRPRTELKRSSAVGFWFLDAGRFSLASSVARATKVDRGRVIPSASCTRCWVAITAVRLMGRATSVCLGCSATGAAAAGAAFSACGGGAGAASWMLERSRWESLVKRAADSAG